MTRANNSTARGYAALSKWKSLFTRKGTWNL